MNLSLPLPRIMSRAGSGAVHVASGILFSRVAGLVRERVFAHYFGNSDAAGAFKAALRIPNILQNLFGEGMLSASFIPVYARLLAEGDEETAGRTAGAVAALLAAAVAALAGLGVLLAPLLVDAVAPGFDGEVRALTIRLVRILFPGVGLLVLSAWCLGILNSHRKFFLSYVAPVFWNLAMIGTLIAFGARLGQASLAEALAWGAVGGSALQFGVQLPFVLRHERRLRLAFSAALEPVRTVLRNLAPVVAGRGVVQLSAYLDSLIASFLGAGAVAGLGYAQTLYLLPISLFGMSVAAAELPAMSGERGAQDEVRERIRRRLAAGLKRIAFFVVPSAVALLFLGRHIVAGLFQTGRFGPQDTLYVWIVLMGPAAGLLAATWGRLYSSAFYALGDTRTPVRFALARVSLSAALGALLAFPLREHWVGLLCGLTGLSVAQLPGGALGIGVAGLTLASGLAGWVEFLLLRRALARSIGAVSLAPGLQAKLWLCALAAAAAAAGCARWGLPRLGEALPVGALPAGAVLVCGVFGAVYVAAALAVLGGAAPAARD